MSDDLVSWLIVQFDAEQIRAMDVIEDPEWVTVHKFDGTKERVPQGRGWGQERWMEIDSLRRIVKALAEADPNAGYITATFTAGDALRLLALPYANRPGYRAEWRP